MKRLKYVIRLLIVGSLVFPLISFGAIARDSYSDGSIVGGTTNTFSHTASGSNRIMFVHSWCRGGNTSSVKYNNVSLSPIGTQITMSNNDKFGMWMLVSPDLGTNNVVVTCAGTLTGGTAASYTGAAQTNQPDNEYQQKSVPVSSLTSTLTTTSTNSWTILFARQEESGVVNAGTGSYLVVNGGGGFSTFDSNGPITPAGSTSMETTQSTSGSVYHIMASFAPSAGGPPVGITRHIRGTGISR